MKIHKQLLALSLCIAIPLMFVGATNLYGLWQVSRHELDESLKQQAQLATVAFERWIDAQRQPLTTIATYAMEHRELPANYMRLMVATRQHYWIDLHVFDQGKQSIFSSPSTTDPLPARLVDKAFSRLQERKSSWIIVMDRIHTTGQTVIAIGVPIEESGGAVINRVRADALKDIFRDIELADDAIITIYDPQGRALYGNATQPDEGGVDISDTPLFAALDGKRTAVVETESPSDGVRRVHGLSRGEATNYVMKIGIPSHALYRPAKQQFARYAFYSALALLCSLVAAVLIARGIAEPLRRLSDIAHRLGAGDSTARAPIAERGEVAELSHTFNQMAEKIAEREARLTELNNLKSEIVSNVSHELRTPLTTIKMLANLMLDTKQREAERRECLEMITTECDRQIDLVLNLLDLARIEAGTFTYHPGRVDMLELLRDCIRVERHAAELHNHDLQANLPADLPLALTDHKAIRRVLCTLIENAIKYTPDGGRITLMARAEENGNVAIQVTDTGRGVRAEDVPHIFEKYYRGRTSAKPDDDDATPDKASASVDNTSEMPGVGLGLYLARTIIEQLQGSISVESQVERGTTFTVRLPAWRGETSEAQTAEQEITQEHLYV